MGPRPVNAITDPLSRQQPTLGRRLLGPAILIVGAPALHALVLLLFAGGGLFLGDIENAPAKKDERVALHVVQTPKPVEAPVVEELPTPKQHTVKRIRKQPAPKVAKTPEPIADPINLEAPSDPPPKNQRKVRRVIGLSMSSTVGAGSGPGFAVGNTRMGTTARVAADPEEASEKLHAERSNKKAAHIPTANVEFVPPRKKFSVRPDYPPTLKAQGIEAEVILAVTVDADGTVGAVKVIKGTKHAEFDKAAVAAATRERYSPATKDGTPIPNQVQFTVRFRLTDY